jgi:hypothetical protein
LGSAQQRVRLGDELPLVATLVRHQLIEFLNKINRHVLKYDPLVFLGNPKDDLLKNACPQGFNCPDWLGIRLKYTADVRVINFSHGKPKVGIALKVKTARIISATCSQLMQQKIDILGLYVCIKESVVDSRIQARLKLVGKITAIKGRMLTLEDYVEGYQEVDASTVYLEPRIENFERCMHQVFTKKFQAVKTALDQSLVNLRGGKENLEKASVVINFLSNYSMPLAPELSFRISENFLDSKTHTFLSSKKTNKPVYIFDVTGKHTDWWSDGGLNRYGPYDARSFTPRSAKICVICQTTNKGRVEQFMQKFLTGLNIRNASRQYFEAGFIRKYHLENPDIEFFTADKSTAEAYRKAVKDSLRFQQEQGLRWNLAFVQIDENFHELSHEKNPYFVTKAAFLSQQIPVQGFEMETTAAPDFQLQYVLNNIALASYAKLGGIPWLLQANPPIAHEFVFGLGSASIGSSRLGERERMIGITTVFSGDGLYHLHNLSDAVPIEDFEETLLKSVRAVIERVKVSMNWQPREQVRLIFHAFKPFKKSEAEAIEVLMKELGDYNVEYAYLHVAEDHSFSLFDMKQSGKSDTLTRRAKGVLAPERGNFIELNKSETLLVLTGPSEIKRSEDGLPQPLLLKLHRSSTFRDMNYLTNQVFSFSCHSWRTFSPASVPVTIMYSELIAGLLGRLSETPDWNPYSIIGNIGSSRWFL